MIINRTSVYLKIRGAGVETPVVFLSVQEIRNTVKNLYVEIEKLKDKYYRSKLPSFTSKKKQFREIDTQKEKIKTIIEGIRKNIDEIKTPEQKLNISIKNYFIGILQKVLIEYRTAQQESLKTISTYDEYLPEVKTYTDEQLQQVNIERSLHLRQSIFNLTNMLLEMKMALKEQTTSIDRIDYHFDTSNQYMEGTNKEIKKMTKYFTKFKDMIIYVLIYIIGLLMIAVIVKGMRRG